MTATRLPGFMGSMPPSFFSYTSFEYGGMSLDGAGVSFTVKNSGSVAGAEIAQVYVAPKCGGVFRPKKELRGFARVYLEPGESRSVHIELPERGAVVPAVMGNDAGVVGAAMLRRDAEKH